MDDILQHIHQGLLSQFCLKEKHPGLDDTVASQDDFILPPFLISLLLLLDQLEGL